MARRTVVLACFGAALVLGGGRADAQTNAPGNHRNQLEIELHAAFNGVYTYYNGIEGFGFGAGGRVNIPVIRNGPVTTINDSLAFLVGADMYFPRYSSVLGVPVGVQWNFYVAPAFSVMLEGGAYLALPFNALGDSTAFAMLALGGRWHFSSDGGYPTLTFRFGYPVGFTLGVSF